MASKQLATNPAYMNYYHLIASAKYRKDLFYDESVRNRMKELIRETLEQQEDTELIASTVAYNHIHVLVQTEDNLSRVRQVLFGRISRILRQEYPELKEEAKDALWGGKSWEPIKDESHFKNAISYINRHQPDNTKLH